LSTKASVADPSADVMLLKLQQTFAVSLVANALVAEATGANKELGNIIQETISRFKKVIVEVV